MDKSPLLCFIVCIGLNVCQVLCQDSDAEKLHNQLINQIFDSYYNTGYKPGNITVRVGLNLVSFDFLDESHEMVSTHVWLSQTWNDSRLIWDPASYDGISELVLGADHVWLPDIEAYTGISTVNTLRTNNVLLKSDGKISRYSSLQHNFICRMDLLYFPYDKQKCILKYGSWHFNAKQLNLILSSEGNHDVYIHNPSQDFIFKEATAQRVETVYSCCPDPFVEIQYIFKLERYSRAYTAKLVIPSVLAGILILATFLVPHGSFERITFCGFLFLTFVLLLIYLQSLVPVSGDTIIGEYIAFAIFVNFFAAVIAVASYNINEWLKSKPGGGMIDAEGKDHIPKLPMGITTQWLKHLDISSFLLFTLVYVIGVAIILGRRG